MFSKCYLMINKFNIQFTFRYIYYMNILATIALLLQLTIQDSITGEKLVGVKVATKSGIYYTDLQGRVTIPGQDSVVVINYVSYQDVLIKMKSDTTIKLNPKVQL